MSNSFANKTDNYLKGEKGGGVIGEIGKFQVETVTNIIPNIVPEEEIDNPDKNKIRE